MTIEGVDYSFSRPSAAALKAAGKRFAVRYGGPGSASKQLTSSELRDLRANGIDVVANAEGSAGGFKGTSAGISWASSAQSYFAALGMPANAPIYFSVDWDAGSADWGGIDAALRGAASVIGASRVGVYGSYDTVVHCHSAGTAKWFWQTYAWSGGKTPPSYVHLYQYKNGVTIGGADCDLTRALQPSYGQWYGEESNMALDLPDDALAVWETDHAVNMPDWHPNKPTNPDISGSYAMWIAMNEAHDANIGTDALKTQVTNLATQLTSVSKAVTTLLSNQQGDTASLLAAINASDIDEATLAAELAPLLLAGLPAGTLTQEGVETALRNVLTHGTEGN